MPRTTRTPGENAGHKAKDADPAEIVAQARSAEDSALGVNQVKTTKPLRGTMEEQFAALQAQVAEQAEHMAGLMAANRALLGQVRATAKDAPEAEELPDLDAKLQKQHDEGKLDRPVLTKAGWLVPRVSASNPEQQLTGALLKSLVEKG